MSTTAVAPAPGSAFLELSASKRRIYAGEGVALTLSFFIADNYPQALNFTALDQQIQQIANRIRPVNAWEENRNITELKPVTVRIGTRTFRQYLLYQAVFFPVAARPLSIPAVTLQLSRPGPANSAPVRVAFTSKPLTIDVQALPVRVSNQQIPVGRFRLVERLNRRRVNAGQSAQYTFQVMGEGNIATLPAPVLLADSGNVDIFPPEERLTINRDGTQITGHKSFAYFIVPNQNGRVSLANRFQWVYFDPQSARYDTLRPRLTLRVGGVADPSDEAVSTDESVAGTTEESSLAARSIYAGLKTQDSSEQPINQIELIRGLASVLILLMLVGVIFIIVKK